MNAKARALRAFREFPERFSCLAAVALPGLRTDASWPTAFFWSVLGGLTAAFCHLGAILSLIVRHVRNAVRHETAPVRRVRHVRQSSSRVRGRVCVRAYPRGRACTYTRVCLTWRTRRTGAGLTPHKHAARRWNMPHTRARAQFFFSTPSKKMKKWTAMLGAARTSDHLAVRRDPCRGCCPRTPTPCPSPIKGAGCGNPERY